MNLADLVSLLANKEFIIAACSMALNVALWRALQKERDDHSADLRARHEKDLKYLEVMVDMRGVITGFRQEFALWREMDSRPRKEDR